jgi:hypothetical protein
VSWPPAPDLVDLDGAPVAPGARWIGSAGPELLVRPQVTAGPGLSVGVRREGGALPGFGRLSVRPPRATAYLSGSHLSEATAVAGLRGGGPRVGVGAGLGVAIRRWTAPDARPVVTPMPLALADLAVPVPIGPVSLSVGTGVEVDLGHTKVLAHGVGAALPPIAARFDARLEPRAKNPTSVREPGGPR